MTTRTVCNGLWAAVVLAVLVVGLSGHATAQERDALVSIERNGAVRTCPELDGEVDPDNPQCIVDVASRRVRMTIETAVGTVDFATCPMAFHLNLGGSGTAAAVGVRATRAYSPCNDVNACPDENGAPIFWPGELSRDADGHLRLLFDACIDTCLGQFSGRVAFRIDRDGDRVRAIVADGALGTSGMRIDGRFDGPQLGDVVLGGAS